MKKIMLLASIFSTAMAFADTNWVTPSDTICKNQKGAIGTYGVCKAQWEDAKEICRLHDARLPTLKELQEEVDKCKSKNAANKDAYVACYKKDGFTGSSSYWSSDVDKKFKNNAYGMNFYSAVAGAGSKANGVDVRCVKPAQ